LRVTICTIVLVCAFVLPGEARPPAGPQQQDPAFCGSIGVAVSPMTRPLAESLGMLNSYGAIFGQPKPGSPAAQAGIEAGDVITAINGAPLVHSRNFAGMISRRAPGSLIYLTIFRNGQLLEIKVTLGYASCNLRPAADQKNKA
jgi:C-terminal processing protease CtpA/Prc